MIDLFKKFKTVIIVVLVIAIAFVVYSYFFAKPAEPVLSTQEVSAVPSVDQDLIAILLQLKSIKLDDAIFSDPAFKSLQDFSQELVQEPVGRNNPFAPLGARQLTPQVR